ncbi:alpha/beta fold hydrolase [Taklimakanibacter deserti]|uniref:alpha/beta fold hydrolase n=1 Tax=Taklimakanibacter deserti TaxID=2267839 RepID=UPI000E64A870
MIPLVMIPALCCDEGLYEDIIPALSDLVSPRIIIPYEATLAACAEKLLGQIEGDFIVMGTSFGGHVAREVALAAPERVKGLWIIGAGAGAIASPQAGLERSAKLRGGEAEDVYQQFYKMITHLPGERGPWAADKFLAMARRSDPLKVARQADALATRPDRWNDIGRIACPTLLLWGVHDQFAPAADGLRMAGLIPYARYVEIADCGHLPTLETPEETLEAARHWLADIKV